jgi:CTP synthase (UTP-ammonia lyase)
MNMVRVGLIGDYNPDVTAHQAIPRALSLAGDRLNLVVQPTWLATDRLPESQDAVAHMQGLWCVPASPYRNMEGALDAIRHARENDVPFLGTCGGFQHAVIEYARNVLRIEQADHAETNPDADDVVVSPLSCSMVEVRGRISLQPGSRIRELYGRDEIEEGYHCNYGLNDRYRMAFEQSGLRFTGFDAGASVRSLELPEHPFFLATLFQPERAALRGELSPVVVGFLRAILQERTTASHVQPAGFPGTA